MHTPSASRGTVASVLGVALLAAGVALSQVAQADTPPPGASPSPSPSTPVPSGQAPETRVHADQERSAEPSLDATADAKSQTSQPAPTQPASNEQPVAAEQPGEDPVSGGPSVSLAPSDSPTPSVSLTPVPRYCPASDAEIQKSFPAASMRTEDGGHNWYRDGELVGRTVNGSGWDLTCPVS